VALRREGLAAITRYKYHRARLVAGSAALALMSLVAIPVSSLAGATSIGWLPRAQGARERVILLLAQQCPQRARLAEGFACPPQDPLLAELKAAGAQVVSKSTLVDTITASVSAAQARALARSPFVSQVYPDGVVKLGPAPEPLVPTTVYHARLQPALSAHGVAPAGELCGTRSAPELDPQALQAITANTAIDAGVNGSGVTVAILADGLHPTNADFLRNAAYGQPGTHVITQYLDFTGEGTNTKTGGEEAFGDASSIAAQGNVAYNLAEYVNPAVAALMPKTGCWVKILGAAPGASVLALQVIGTNDEGTDSDIVLAVQYAVQHGAKVINESLGSNPFPDTSLDVVRDADDAAVAAGVTVVVSSGDGGASSTIGSPATDPDVISVGATTNFRAYAQSDLGGFYNPAVGNGHWVSNNISSISSGGFDQAGGTVDLVAPGDSNWALCSTNPKMYSDCADTFRGTDIGVDAFGGTSEAAPLTAAGAADVIEAYERTHGGSSPSPALVKQILCSSATDVDAPAAEQGAGMLNIDGAVRLAESLPAPSAATTTTSTTTTSTTTGTTTTTTANPGTTTTNVAGASTTTTAATTTTSSPSTTTTTVKAAAPPVPGRLGPLLPPQGSVLIGPTQVNVLGRAGSTTHQTISLTNTASVPATVELSTRALSQKVYDTGVHEFVMDPTAPTTNTGAFPIWNGATEVYQTETFNVPARSGGRLFFAMDYQHTNQSSLLHVALYEPDGTYAAYSDPQGLGDYGEVEVANPPAGKWTAFFFTELNGATKGAIGTSGAVQWDASVWDYARGSTITPASLTIPAGQTATAELTVTNPAVAGDTNESVVVKYDGGRTTVPVTIRTTVSIGTNGGTFSGVLFGGNGRQAVAAQTNTYFFNVPKSKSDLDVSIALQDDPDEGLVGYLVDPEGQTEGYSTNYTLVPSGSSFEPTAPFGLVPGTTPYLQLYHADPQPGAWELVLEWENPVTGNELQESFSGAVRFNQVLLVQSGLPNSAAKKLARGRATTVTLDIANTGVAPEGYFVDPRLDKEVAMTLKNLSPGTSATRLTLPRSASANFPIGIPLYLVPTDTSQLKGTVARLSGSAGVSFDMSPLTGDPEISPLVPNRDVKGSGSAGLASATLSEPDVTPGLWDVEPTEMGPFGTAAGPKELVDTTVTAVTRAFDTSMHTGSDDLWQVGFKFARFYYVEPDQVAQVKVQIVPTAAAGTQVSGVLYIDDFTLASFSPTQAFFPSADQVAALPYSYTVSP